MADPPLEYPRSRQPYPRAEKMSHRVGRDAQAGSVRRGHRAGLTEQVGRLREGPNNTYLWGHLLLLSRDCTLQHHVPLLSVIRLTEQRKSHIASEYPPIRPPNRSFLV